MGILLIKLNFRDVFASFQPPPPFYCGWCFRFIHTFAQFCALRQFHFIYFFIYMKLTAMSFVMIMISVIEFWLNVREMEQNKLRTWSKRRRSMNSRQCQLLQRTVQVCVEWCIAFVAAYQSSNRRLYSRRHRLGSLSSHRRTHCV